MTVPRSLAEWPAWIKRSLLTGLAVLLPAVLTVYILWLLFRITGVFLRCRWSSWPAACWVGVWAAWPPP